MREIVLDTETTGLEPKKGDRLVEIGCVEIINRFITGKTFHRYLNPERQMNPEAFKVHGLSDAFLKDKPIFSAIVNDFLAFIGEDTLVIHNAEFDLGFLNMELNRLKYPPLTKDRVVDTLMLARRRYPGVPNTLDALCARYGIDTSRRTKHGALLDSELLADIYAELTGGRQSNLGLTTNTMAEDDASHETQARVHLDLPKISLLTEEEEAQHRTFVAKLGEKAIWNRYLTPLQTEEDAPQTERPIGQETPVPPNPQ